MNSTPSWLLPINPNFEAMVRALNDLKDRRLVWGLFHRTPEALRSLATTAAFSLEGIPDEQLVPVAIERAGLREELLASDFGVAGHPCGKS